MEFIWKTRIEKKTKNLPKELIGVIDNETFEKSRSYAIDKGVYNLIRGTYSMFEAYVINLYSIIFDIKSIKTKLFPYLICI